MKFFTIATALVAGAILSSATPTPAPKERTLIHIPIEKKGASLTKPDSDQVDFEKVYAHLGHLRTKYEKNLDSFLANTGVEHPLRVAVPARKSGAKGKGKGQVPGKGKSKGPGTGTVPLTDVHESLWTGTLAYGTPPQNIKVDFDTGSADTLVIPGAYDPHASSTSVRTEQTFSTAYGDGTNARGTVYTDVLTIGGLKAAKTAIGLSSSRFLNSTAEGGNHGISGMAFPSLATFGDSYPPFFDSLHNAGVLSSFQFAFKLGSSGSHLYLGGHDPSDIIGAPTWLSVDSAKGFWQVPATADGYKDIESVVDTGTTIIVAPFFAAWGFFRSIGVETRIHDFVLFGAYDCAKPPAVSFTFGGKRIALDKEAMSIGKDDDGACLLSVIGQETGMNAWITGDALLRNTVAIFDRTNRRVGFGTRASGPQ
ncbi:hypothetical protein A4X06_0g1929 [Tilletia controversa]|uniref:Peptidase A1 domain-containing protein n=1 Tax=Tilletia controversa TaxID=13291 RepID=A0A8X7SZ91_9BASI|nr:hypothetical protein CF328_g1454 [Tilletia controversa]KAE8252774.1 hypothetical protein A4X06_0g1929 [Tilletia controversa]